MRLTLRTLLAWHDGVLPPEEQREFAGRVAASTVAAALVGRMEAAVGACDAGAPRPDAWGSPEDPNFVAAYLDNRLLPDQVEWFERVCIQSAVNLAEVADCHGALVEMSRLSQEQLSLTDGRAASLKSRLLTPGHTSVPAAAPLPAGRVADAAAGHGDASGAGTLADSRDPAAPIGRARTRGESRRRRRPTRGWFGNWGGMRGVSRSSSKSDEPRGGKTPKDRAKAGVGTEGGALAATLLALVVLGGGLVTWFNLAGPARGPRRASVQGFVTFDGLPLEDGVVVFMPVGGTKGPTAGSSVSKGVFTIAAASGPVLGRYRVEVKATRKTGRTVKGVIPVAGRKNYEETEQFIPARYNTDSEIEVEIKTGRNKVSLELKSASQPGAATKAPRVVAERVNLPPVQTTAASRSAGRPG